LADRAALIAEARNFAKTHPYAPERGLVLDLADALETAADENARLIEREAAMRARCRLFQVSLEVYIKNEGSADLRKAMTLELQHQRRLDAALSPAPEASQ
jgi:hypothetical protein